MHRDHDHDHVPAAAGPGAERSRVRGSALRLGIGGPVGSGKTALVAALCRTLGEELALAVVTNDIYTTEDADFLLRNGVIPAERVRAVETGACPHTAIRDDISANLETVEELETSLPPLDLVLIESGGDNLTATVSRGLIDYQIFVIDVAEGDKIPRKGGPGVTTADLLVINKTDLATRVGADLGVMDRDAKARRGELPVRFTSPTEDPAPPSGCGRGSARAPRRPGACRALMLAQARLATERGPRGRTRVTELRSAWPLMLRHTYPAEPAAVTAWAQARGPAARVHVAGAAAGPVGGDELGMDSDVAAGSALILGEVSPTLLLPAPTGMAGAEAAVMALRGRGWLASALAGDTAALRRRLEEVLAAGVAASTSAGRFPGPAGRPGRLPDDPAAQGGDHARGDDADDVEPRGAQRRQGAVQPEGERAGEIQAEQ